MTNKPHLITKDGLVRLEKDLHRLETVEREKVAERLTAAFDDGQDDEFVDNAELEAARRAQAFLEGRILEIREILSNHTLIDEDDGTPHDFVRVGDWVTIVEEDDEDEFEEKYHLVGPAEADPSEGRISNESPLGKALLGQKVNDLIRVNAPNGIITFRIIKIE